MNQMQKYSQLKNSLNHAQARLNCKGEFGIVHVLTRMCVDIQKRLREN